MRILISAFCALALLTVPALAAERAALVIGNGAYQSVTPLVNPPNDATDMAASLKKLGYAVTLVTDGSIQQMNDGLRGFLRDADRADSAVIFYAGHGVQVNGKNYLIPVDATITDELDLDTKTVSLDKLLDLVDRASVKVRVVILDACRDNPLMKTLVRGGGTRGLARLDMPGDSAKGTLIAFSTAPGKVAQDGEGRNSPFTAALLKNIATPGLDIRAMFGQVRADVDVATKGSQTPWVNEAIVGAFSLSGPASAATPPAQPASTPVQPPAADAATDANADASADTSGDTSGDTSSETAVQGTTETEEPAAEVPAKPAKPAKTLKKVATRSIPDFIIPDSDSREVTQDDLEGLSAWQLRIARNEIYARKGRFMKDDKLRTYFEQFSWYEPFTWDPTLNAIEKANVAFIKQAEDGQ